MKFRSPTETTIHLSLTSGHTFVVGPTPVEVSPEFHVCAIQKGCEPIGPLPQSLQKVAMEHEAEKSERSAHEAFERQAANRARGFIGNSMTTSV
jgi:hypothetical protein